MIQNAYERLKADPDTAAWWQVILKDERFGLVIDAAKVLLEQSPPVIPPGANPMEVFGLSYSANLGAKAALSALEKLGTDTFVQDRIGEDKLRRGAAATAPSVAGTGPGRHSTPPPEVTAATGGAPAASEAPAPAING